MSILKTFFTRFQWIAFVYILTIVSVKGQTSALNYQVSKNTTLKAILVNGDSIDNFNQDLNAFEVNLPYTTTKSPLITAIPFHPGNIIRIFQASNILGSEKERTTRILVSSKDKAITEIYKVRFTRLPKLDLFLLIGQSNMAGRGTLSSDYLDTLTNVFLLTPTNNMEPAMNPLNKYSNIRKALEMQKIGPGYEFSKKIVAETGIEIGLIVNARGGSSINSWEKGNKDQYYEKTLGRMKAALKWGNLRAILWHQGESDSGQTDTYMVKLSNMVQNFRTDLGYPKVYFVAGELAYWRKESTAFNAMIRTIPTKIPNSSWVSAEDLTPLINTTDPHFDTKSQLLLGERYAEKVLQSCYSK
jgi:DNA-directed RNA polymerase subunit H (RpoH/RPB5)